MSAPPRKPAHELRSQQWFGRHDRDGFIYRSWLKGKGVPHDQFDGRPVIGICNTFSELTPCNSHFRTLAEQVKIGVYEGAPAREMDCPETALGLRLLEALRRQRAAGRPGRRPRIPARQTGLLRSKRQSLNALNRR